MQRQQNSSNWDELGPEYMPEESTVEEDGDVFIKSTYRSGVLILRKVFLH